MKSIEGKISKITFIIKTFKRYQCLNALLRSIYKFYPTVKIIIADDNISSEYKAFFYLRWKRRLNIETIKMPFDTGVSAGRNAMVDKIKTQFALLLDDDFIFTKETDIEKFYKVLISNEKAGVIGGTCLTKNKEVHYECLLDLKDGILRQLSDDDKWQYVNGVKCKKTQCVLNFFLARTKTLKENPWDNELKIAEHTDFFLRLSRTEWETYYTPEVKIIHDRQRKIGNYTKYRARGTSYTAKMFKKNGIKKMISINGGVKELAGNGIKKYKIFNV